MGCCCGALDGVGHWLFLKGLRFKSRHGCRLGPGSVASRQPTQGLSDWSNTLARAGCGPITEDQKARDLRDTTTAQLAREPPAAFHPASSNCTATQSDWNRCAVWR